MKNTENTDKQLRIIATELNLSKRLDLFLKHGFKEQANAMLWHLVRKNATMFSYENDSELCVVITSQPVCDYEVESGSLTWRIAFPFVKMRNTFGWSPEHSQEFVRKVLAQSLVCPLNHWRYTMVEGTAYAAREFLADFDPMKCEITAMYLVYHLRKAEFGTIFQSLAHLNGVPTPKSRIETITSDWSRLINWMVSELKRLGWTDDRIRKELVEWIRLKKDTWPHWLLAVATAHIFSADGLTRNVAVRWWLMQSFDHILSCMSGEVSKHEFQRKQKAEMITSYVQLLLIGDFGLGDQDWMVERLVARMVSGDLSSVRSFIDTFTCVGLTDRFNEIRDRAVAAAKLAGNHGIAYGLMQSTGLTPDDGLTEIVRLRELSTELT